MGRYKPTKKRVEDLVAQIRHCAEERMARRAARAPSAKQQRNRSNLAARSREVGNAWQRYKAERWPNAKPPTGSYKKFVVNYHARGGREALEED